LTDGTADQTDEVTLQPTTSVKHDKIRQMVDANYAKTVQNTMRKNNKKVSRDNDSIVKGSFVTVRILTVDSASGDLPRLLCKIIDVVGKDGSLFKLACPYGIRNSFYDMGDLELFNSVVDSSHWVEALISLHAAAKQASCSLSCKRCKCECKDNCTAKSCKVERQKFVWEQMSPLTYVFKCLKLISTCTCMLHLTGKYV
jgi:hypothetical protein